MAPILELIKKNAVPVNVMRSAAKGALPLSADESLEVLVYLTQNPVFGQDARMTLAKWDALSAIEVLSKDTAAPEVLIYFWQEENRRGSLMPTLIENLAIPENSLIELAAHAPREIVTMLLASPRVRASAGVVESLLTNECLTPVEKQSLQEPAVLQLPAALPEIPEIKESVESDPESEAAHQAFQQEHKVEIAAEENKPFELTPEETPEAASSPAAGSSEGDAAPSALAAAAASAFAAQDE